MNFEIGLLLGPFTAAFIFPKEEKEEFAEPEEPHDVFVGGPAVVQMDMKQVCDFLEKFPQADVLRFMDGTPVTHDSLMARLSPNDSDNIFTISVAKALWSVDAEIKTSLGAGLAPIERYYENSWVRQKLKKPDIDDLYVVGTTHQGKAYAGTWPKGRD